MARMQELHELERKAVASLAAEREDQSHGMRPGEYPGRSTVDLLVSAACVLSECLADEWRSRIPATSAGAPAGDDARASSGGSPSRWANVAEELIAMVVASLLGRLLRQLRYFTIMMTGGALFLLIFSGAYPWQPRRLFAAAAGLVMITVVIAGLLVYIRLEYNEVLSLIGKTEAGRLTRGFLPHAFTWGVLPIVSVVVTQFPEVASSLRGWLDPLFRLLQ